MSRRTRKASTTAVPRFDPSAGWTRSKEFVAASGRHVEPGTELSIRGERGRFRFMEHVVTEKGVEWLAVVGGPKGVTALRAFRPDRVRTVHVKKQHMTAERAKAVLREKRAAKAAEKKR